MSKRILITGAGSGFGEGAAIGAQSLVTRPLRPWTIYAGAPAKVVRERRRDILDLEIRLRGALTSGQADLPVARI